MGLLDSLKQQAADLIDGAKDRASEATGIDVDEALDVADRTLEAAEHIEAATEAIDAATGRHDEK